MAGEIKNNPSILLVDYYTTGLSHDDITCHEKGQITLI